MPGIGVGARLFFGHRLLFYQHMLDLATRICEPGTRSPFQGLRLALLLAEAQLPPQFATNLRALGSGTPFDFCTKPETPTFSFKPSPLQAQACLFEPRVQGFLHVPCLDLQKWQFQQKSTVTFQFDFGGETQSLAHFAKGC